MPIVLVVLVAPGMRGDLVMPVVLVVLGALGMHDELVVPVVLVVRVAPGMQDEPVVPVVLVVLVPRVARGTYVWSAWRHSPSIPSRGALEPLDVPAGFQPWRPSPHNGNGDYRTYA